MNELMATGPEPIDGAVSEIVRYVGRIDDKESAEDCIKRMRTWESMLDQADAFGQYASTFCYLEAKMLVNISRLDVEVDRRRELVSWLRAKGDDEVDAILSECATGVRISTLKARETRAENRAAEADAQIAEHKRICSEIIAELEETGHTTLSTSSYIKRWGRKEAPDPVAVHAFIEHTRDSLLSRGGAGLGDRTGTYVVPSIARQDELRKLVVNKLNSIHDDLMSLHDTLSEARLALTADDTAQLREDIGMLETLDD